MTADHLFPILASDRDSSLLAECASVMARGDVPEEVLEWVRMERITALAKPDGGVRGIVVGDILRRLVARTMAHEVSKNAEKATAPFQHTLSTRAGCECVANVVQALTHLNPEDTVVSIDGIGAFDLISRNAMLGDGKWRSGAPLHAQFLRTSVHLSLEGRDGDRARDHPGGRRGAGRCLMPVAIHSRLQDDEKLFAFLDDIYIVCTLARVEDVHKIMKEELWAHAR